METMKLNSFEDILDETYGKVGSVERDNFEKQVDEALEAYRLGEKIREARKVNNLTQEQLGERIGVGKSQISKMEKGKGITIPKLRRIFRALNMPIIIDFGKLGKLAY